MAMASFCLILFPRVSQAAVTYPEASKAFYVYDEASILSQTTNKFIVDVNKHYEETKEKPQIVVATVNNLQGLTIEEYASHLFEKWKIGNKTDDNGVLILFSKEDRKIRFEVGYGLEGALTDSGTGQILDRNIDLLKKDQFDEALKQIFTETALKVNKEYGYKDDTIFSGYAVDPSDYKQEDSKDSPVSIFTILFIIILAIFSLVAVEIVAVLVEEEGEAM